MADNKQGPLSRSTAAQGNVMVVNFFYSRILMVEENEYVLVAIYTGKFL